MQEMREFVVELAAVQTYSKLVYRRFIVGRPFSYLISTNKGFTTTLYFYPLPIMTIPSFHQERAGISKVAFPHEIGHCYAIATNDCVWYCVQVINSGRGGRLYCTPVPHYSLFLYSVLRTVEIKVKGLHNDAGGPEENPGIWDKPWGFLRSGLQG